jgi:hypothetical protein
MPALPQVVTGCPGQRPVTGVISPAGLSGVPAMAEPDTGPKQTREAGPRPGSAASFGDLLSDLIRELTGLVSSEGRLARAEIAGAARIVAGGTEMMAAGAVLLLVAMIVLLQALVIALAQYVGPGWASTIIGAAFGLLGALLILRGQKSVRSAHLIPERTLEQTSRDLRLAKEQI